MNLLMPCFLICAAGPREHAIGFEEIYSAALGGFDRETVIVSADERSFAELWSQVMGFLIDKPAAVPHVDFENHLVLAYFPGVRPTLGYGFEVNGVSLLEGKRPALVLRVTETPPGEVAAQMISRPVIVLKLNRADGPPEWWKKGFKISIKK